MLLFRGDQATVFVTTPGAGASLTSLATAAATDVAELWK